MILPQLRSFLRSLALPSPARVVVAVSGGPDSLCLLHALHALREELQLELHVAHLDHAFRGDEAAAEAAFVAGLARRLGLEATVERRDVPALIAREGLNAQAAARAVRYDFLAEVALATGAHAVAVAHHADDQAETVLLHLLRGAGPAGLRGMRAVVGWDEWANQISILNSQFPALIRPLLPIRRHQIEAYCAEHGLEPRRDPSNASPRYARARVRAALLPLLAEYNPHVVERLADTAAICADDYDYMRRQLEACWGNLVATQGEGHVVFDGAAWRALHPALQRQALRRAALALGGDEISFEQVEAARRAAQGGVGARSELPGGVRLVVGYNGFALRRASLAVSTGQPQLEAREVGVAVPGVSAIGDGWRLETFTSAPPDWRPGSWCAIFDADALGGPLALRARRPGDRIRLPGGTRSLQNLLVDQKLPRALRDRWPLLVAAPGVAWVIGVRADTRFVAGENTARLLWARCTHERPDHKPSLPFHHD